jgi:hypothetical protein
MVSRATLIALQAADECRTERDDRVVIVDREALDVVPVPGAVDHREDSHAEGGGRRRGVCLPNS